MPWGSITYEDDLPTAGIGAVAHQQCHATFGQRDPGNGQDDERQATTGVATSTAARATTARKTPHMKAPAPESRPAGSDRNDAWRVATHRESDSRLRTGGTPAMGCHGSARMPRSARTSRTARRALHRWCRCRLAPTAAGDLASIVRATAGTVRTTCRPPTDCPAGPAREDGAPSWNRWRLKLRHYLQSLPRPPPYHHGHFFSTVTRETSGNSAMSAGETYPTLLGLIPMPTER